MSFCCEIDLLILIWHFLSGGRCCECNEAVGIIGKSNLIFSELSLMDYLAVYILIAAAVESHNAIRVQIKVEHFK